MARQKIKGRYDSVTTFTETCPDPDDPPSSGGGGGSTGGGTGGGTTPGTGGGTSTCTYDIVFTECCGSQSGTPHPSGPGNCGCEAQNYPGSYYTLYVYCDSGNLRTMAATSSYTLDPCPPPPNESCHDSVGDPCPCNGSGTGCAEPAPIPINVSKTSQKLMGILDVEYGTPEADAILLLSEWETKEVIAYLASVTTAVGEAFAWEAITAFANDGDVNFAEGIIVNILDDCQENVISNAVDNGSPLPQLVMNIFNYGNNDVNLVIESSTSVSGTASTQNLIKYNSQSQYCFIKTTLSQNYLKTGTDLSIARTIAHETMHAALVYMVLSGEFIINGNADPDFSALMDGFTNYLSTNDNSQYEGAQHDIMTEIVEDIASSISNYGLQAGYTLPFSYYKDLAWGGLTHYLDANGSPQINPLFLQAVPNFTDRNRIINTVAAEAFNSTQGNISPKGQPCN